MTGQEVAVDFRFEREVRTPYSEVFTILEGEEALLGRLDVHYAGNLVHASLFVTEQLTQEEIQELIEDVDKELLDAVGLARDDLIIHVHQGRDLGVFSSPEYSDDGDGVD